MCPPASHRLACKIGRLPRQQMCEFVAESHSSCQVAGFANVQRHFPSSLLLRSYRSSREGETSAHTLRWHRWQVKCHEPQVTTCLRGLSRAANRGNKSCCSRPGALAALPLLLDARVGQNGLTRRLALYGSVDVPGRPCAQFAHPCPLRYARAHGFVAWQRPVEALKTSCGSAHSADAGSC